jgi:hypothetical protein
VLRSAELDSDMVVLMAFRGFVVSKKKGNNDEEDK